MEIADLIYARIKHGDAKHRAWLRDMANELALHIVCGEPVIRSGNKSKKSRR